MLTVLGTPVVLAPSWFVLVALLTVLYGPELAQLGGLGAAAGYLLALAFALALGLTVVLHELGHLVVARVLGLPVRQVSIMLLGGATEVVRPARSPRTDYAIALAGPLVSLLVAAGGAAVALTLAPGTPVELLVRGVGLMNLLLAVFNLLPALPLDGGRLLRAAVWRTTGRATTGSRAAAWGGRVLAAVVVLGTAAVGLRLETRDLLDVALTAALTAALGGLLAAFLWLGASAVLRGADLEDRLPSLRVRDLVRPWLGVAGDVPLAVAVRRAQAAGARALVVLDGAGRPSGLVSEAAVREVPEQRRAWVTVATLARALGPGSTLPIDLAGEAVVTALRERPASEYLVRDGDAVAGVLATEDVGAVLSGRRPAPRTL